jgi:hypothetical protein
MLCVGLLGAACSMNVKVDPTGYRCDTGNGCPAGYACVADVCEPTAVGLCANVTCSQAPQCTGTTIRTFAGACNPASGACTFAPTDTVCLNGCAKSACIDACKGVTCTTPPASSCTGNVLHKAQTTGTCNTTTGACDYSFTDTTCTTACMNGACVNQDACAGVTCTTPPAPVCDGKIARTYAATGSCAAGLCTYASTDVTCTDACAAGSCVSATATFAQTGPRLKFAISALDVAPNSNGALVVAVGQAGNVARWNGTDWAVLATPTKANLNAVHFVTPTAAWIVGEKRTVWTYRNGVVSAVSNPPGSGNSNFVSVFGKSDALVLLADDSGNWHKWSGASFASGALPAAKGPYVMTSVFIDDTNRERIGGRCGSTTHQTCIAYRNPPDGLDWGIDLDVNSDSSGCSVVGPWVDLPPLLGGPDVLCGKPTNDLRRHNPLMGFSAPVLAPVPVLDTGNGIEGITGGASHATYVLTSSSGTSQTGELYRLMRAGLTVPVEPLWSTTFGEEHLSLNDSAGVVLADVRRPQDANDIVHRSPTVNEAFDLAEDWAAVTANSAGDLVLVSTAGSVALRKASTPAVFSLVRGPAQVTVQGAAAQNGTGVLLVGAQAVTGASVIERYAAGVGFSQLATASPNVALNSVCRVSDAEAYAVGTSGTIYAINSTALTATRMASGTSDDLLWVDCGGAGTAVACGKNGTVLRLANGAWAKVTPAYPSAARLSGCQLVGGAIWATGDASFGRLDPSASAWSTLPSKAGLRGVFVRAPDDVYAYTTAAGTSDVQHFDGTTWKSLLQVRGTLRSGVQINSKIDFAGGTGLVVEGQ